MSYYPTANRLQFSCPLQATLREPTPAMRQEAVVFPTAQACFLIGDL